MGEDNLKKERILIVDDDVIIRELLQRILEVEGFASDTVTSAEEALALLEEKSYGLMIADIRMLGMDGLKLLQIARQRWSEMQVVMGTGIDERDTALEALKEGAVGYMLKPFERIEVLVNVNNALRLRQLEIFNRDQREQLELEVARRTAELVESHRKMVAQEKLASVGQLAAGVAHEVNNPTGYIASNLNTLQRYLARLEKYLAAQQQAVASSCDDVTASELKKLRKQLKIDVILDDIDEIVADSLEGTERIRRIVMGLKNFSRKDAEEQQLLDVNKVLEETLTLCWNELKYKADVVRDFGPLPKIMGLSQKLSQVFLNLLVNAAQAIEEQGQIRVSTLLVDEWIEVAISDSGCGIPEENRKKIFEPFFTTKEAGIGTGLGLAILQDIIGQHQGEIRVQSRVGEGTTFTVCLPVGDARK